MRAVRTRESAVSVSNIIWLQNSFPAVVSRRMREKLTTEVLRRLQRRGNYKEVLSSVMLSKAEERKSWAD